MYWIPDLPDDQTVQAVGNDFLKAAMQAGMWWHQFEDGEIIISCAFCLEHHCPHKRQCTWKLTYDYTAMKIAVRRYGRVPCAIDQHMFLTYMNYPEDYFDVPIQQDKPKVSDDTFLKADIYLRTMDREYEKEQKKSMEEKKEERERLMRGDPSTGRR